MCRGGPTQLWEWSQVHIFTQLCLFTRGHFPSPIVYCPSRNLGLSTNTVVTSGTRSNTTHFAQLFLQIYSVSIPLGGFCTKCISHNNNNGLVLQRCILFTVDVSLLLPDGQIGCGSSQNWPLRSPDFIPVNSHVWGLHEESWCINAK